MNAVKPRHLLVAGVCSALILLLPALSNAEIAGWYFSGSVDSSEPYPPLVTGVHVSVDSLRKAPTLTPVMGASVFLVRDWPTSPMIDPEKYLEFEVAAEPGYDVFCLTVEFSLYNNFHGTSSWEIRCSEDGYATALDSGSVTDIISDGQTVTADVSGIGLRSGSVNFRLYTYGNTGTTNPDQRGLRGNTHGGRDLKIYGFVTPSPAMTELALWDLNGSPLDSSVPLQVSSSATGVSGGALTLASALTAQPFVNAYMASDWPTAPAIDVDKYFEFDVGPSPGFQILYEAIEFSLYNNHEGSSSWQIRSSADGFTSVLDSGHERVIFGGGAPVRADVSGMEATDQFITFRFYTFNNSGETTPDQRGFRGSRFGGDDLKIYGLVFAQGPVDVARQPALDYRLRQNYPNPFRPQTVIEFTIPTRERVELSIFDLRGRHVRSLVDGERPAGTHRATWDGRDAKGTRVAPGVYWYQLEGAAFVRTNRMVLLD